MATIYGDRWEIVQSLGEGGQAHTFLTKDVKGEGVERYVLKRLKNLNRIDRFKSEIEAVRNLSHENIVSLIDFDLEASKPYLVTEYCSGGSLSKAEPFWHKSPTKALKIFQQICEGVAHAHSNNIIHRDLKPDNIFLRTKKGPPVVGDFGICYLEEDGTRVTLIEEAVGSRLFMAPELEDGRIDVVSPESDIYSLGKLLYWLLSGRQPFSREKHRDPQWDLKGKNPESWSGWNNIYMEHVNRLLDGMILVDAQQRTDIDSVLAGVRQVARLVQKEYNPVSEDIPQLCTYCGIGYYVLKAKGVYEAQNLGFKSVGSPNWRILICNKCGHMQSFRVDMADRKDWWGEEESPKS